MTLKLKNLIETTAKTIVVDADECLMQTNAIKRTEKHLEKFANSITEDMVERVPTPAPVPPAA